LPVDDTTPLALRGRFKEQMSLVFASEVLAAIARQLEGRDDNGRPLLLPREAKPIVDAARAAVTALAAGKSSEAGGDGARFAGSPVLRPLIAAGSQRVLGQAIDAFDPKEPDRFLPVDSIDERLQMESEALLEESFAQPELAVALMELIELDEALAHAIEQATTDLLQCGCERRTILVVPKDKILGAAAETIRAARPLAAIVAADVDDVLVVSEETGISPRSFALGLERVFPGIAEAAGRLFTRTDVEWKNLV
jgi:hypothetical protein